MSVSAAQALFAAFHADAQLHGERIAGERLLARFDPAACGAEACCELASSLLQAGFAGAALALLDVAVANFSAAPDLHYWRGNALRLNGRYPDAEAELRGVLERIPAHRDAAYSLAHMLRERGHTNAAVQVMATLVRHRRDRDTIMAVLGFLIECTSYAQANEIAQEAALRWSQDAQLHALTGEIQLALGAFADARDHFRIALDRDPALSTAWLRLAQCQRYVDRDDADIRRYRAACADRALARIPRTCAAFALGKALDDLGDFSVAATLLRNANASAALDAPWNTAAWQDFVDHQIALPQLPVLTDDPEFVPVFIVGLPRSGTTLLATRLSRYTGVRDAGELPWIASMHEHLQSRGMLHDPQALRRTRQMIAALMQRDDTPAPRWIVDKNPLNFRYLNFVHAIFPNARIIHCQRTLRDTALSIWQQRFAHDDLAFSYAFETIAEFFHGYRRLMRHWLASLPLAIVEADYEALVADTDAQLRRIATFLQLDDTASEAQRVPHAIVTASVWQARQPVHSRSVGRWRNYAPFLPELATLIPD